LNPTTRFFRGIDFMHRHRHLPARFAPALLALGLLATFAFAATPVRRPDPSTMQPYVLVILTRGPESTPERTPHTDSIQAGHMANIRKMHADGFLVGAGPFLDDSKVRGLFLFRDMPLDSIRALLVDDPAIKSGRLLAEMHRWYAPRGMGVAYEARAKQRPDHPDSMLSFPLAFLKRPAKLAPVDSATQVAAGAGHMGHILDMLLDGRLLAAGPFFDDAEYRGVSIFSTDSATARRLSMDDPAVKAGRLSIEMHTWMTAWGVLPPGRVVKEMGK
jgi:uncharacterized protein YciI